MARTADDDILLRELPQDGSTTGNFRLMEKLGWEEERYWKVRDRLLDAGKVGLGKGRGGSVYLIVTTAPKPAQPSVQMAPPGIATPTIARETDLYPPLADTLRQQWRQERRLDNFLVEITGLQGSRPTGGTWTRPDLTGISVRRFAYVPGVHFDVWTFEVKPTWSGEVIGVFEAAAHSRFATRSYVLYHVDKPEIDATLETCVDEARRFGIGLVSFVDPRDFKTWEVHVDATRRSPDPELLDEFVATQVSEQSKHELQKWLR